MARPPSSSRREGAGAIVAIGSAPAAAVRLSIWAIPDAADRRHLSSLIEATSSRLATPTFSPHLTVVGDAGADVGAAHAAVVAVPSGAMPTSVRVTGVSHSASFFRAIVLECALASPLLTIRHRLVDALEIEDPGGFRPHVSIAYGAIDPVARERAASSLTREVGREVALAAIEVWDTSHDDPAHWHRVRPHGR